MVRTFVQQLQKRVKDSCLPTKSSGTAKASKILQETTSTLPYELRVLEAAIDNVSPLQQTDTLLQTLAIAVLQIFNI